MNIQSYPKMEGNYCTCGGRRKRMAAGTADFQASMKAQISGRNTNASVQGKRAELLSKFPALTEEKLDALAREYDIENMDSEALGELASKLAEDGTIPARPQTGGLHMIAVYPKELYDAFLRGEISQTGSIVREAPGFCYSADARSGDICYEYPTHGLDYLRYDMWMMQGAFTLYNSYYTEEERSMQIQLSNSKWKFLELSEFLAAYQEEVLQA